LIYFAIHADRKREEVRTKGKIERQIKHQQKPSPPSHEMIKE